MAELTKIAAIITPTGIKPSDSAYHTWRDLLNKKKRPAGKCRILVLKADNIVRCEYLCPECGHNGYIEQPWVKPIFFNCQKCKAKITVSKLKDQIKKESKAAKKAD
ncbi:MAG: hypothetical protein ABIG30_01825 [Candidatus Aenigmatarchaeota archaeon]